MNSIMETNELLTITKAEYVQGYTLIREYVKVQRNKSKEHKSKKERGKGRKSNINRI